jgi:hypothetical protein
VVSLLSSTIIMIQTLLDENENSNIIRARCKLVQLLSQDHSPGKRTLISEINSDHVRSFFEKIRPANRAFVRIQPAIAIKMKISSSERSISKLSSISANSSTISSVSDKYSTQSVTITPVSPVNLDNLNLAVVDEDSYKNADSNKQTEDKKFKPNVASNIEDKRDNKIRERNRLYRFTKHMNERYKETTQIELKFPSLKKFNNH